MQVPLRLRLGLRLAGTLCVAALCAPCRASPSVCAEPERESFAAVGLVNHERARLDADAASTNQETRDFALHLTRDSGRFAWGISHRYQIFDFAEIEPQTNGHLHTTFVPLHWTFERFRLSVAPALSASSNVMGHPREWQSETPQLLAALVAEARLSAVLGLRYGLCGDHRFGEYRVYPAAALVWHPGRRWRIELGFPVSSVAFEAGSLRSTLGIAPDGNEWHVKDRELASGSRLVYEAFALEWSTGWQVSSGLTLSVSLGRQLDNRYEMTLADGQRASPGGAPANRVGLGVRWSF